METSLEPLNDLNAGIHWNSYFIRYFHSRNYLWLMRCISSLFGIIMIIILIIHLLKIIKFLRSPVKTTNHKKSEIYIIQKKIS